jgi:hypothetical protein
MVNYSMDDTPFDVVDEIDMGDLSDVKGQDVIDPAANVKFTIMKASVRTVNLDPKSKNTTDDNPAVLKNLALEVAITEGINEEGKYRNKRFFPEIPVWANPDHKTKDWYKSRKYLFPVKQLIKALGYDEKNAPKINDAFCSDLIGKEFLADIKQTEIQVRQPDDKYVGTGDYKNEVKNFKKA